MDDLISREDALKALDEMSYKSPHESATSVVRKKHFGEILEKFIMQQPSAQPERKTGRWEITEAYPHNVYCSECHKKFAQKHWEVWFDGSLPRNYCPNCGADMRGEQNG